MMKIPQLLLLLCMSFVTYAQTDTIFKTDHETIVCRINKINQQKIFYFDLRETGRFIDLSKVTMYNYKGKRTVVDPYNTVKGSFSRTDSVNISEEIAYLRFCMTKFHSQYTTGLGIAMVGGALAGTSFFIGDETTSQITGIGGVVLMLAGIAVTVDAHRWFGKAGWGVSGKGNMVQVRYRFK